MRLGCTREGAAVEIDMDFTLMFLGCYVVAVSGWLYAFLCHVAYCYEVSYVI